MAQGKEGTWSIELTSRAREMLAAIQDRRVREQLAERIDRLKHDPEIQGKPLSGPLSGYRSIRAAARRYRIIYTLDKGRIIVLVVAAGLRKEGDRRDIYELARKLLRQGLI